MRIGDAVARQIVEDAKPALMSTKTAASPPRNTGQLTVMALW